MEKKILKFPEGFLWGAATSAHQVEGGNTNDWSEWEKKNAKRLSREAGKVWQPWQIEKFESAVDIFMNSNSFVEMPNYIDFEY